MASFVGDGQFFTTFSATSSQNAAAISGCHSLKETVFVTSLAL